MDDIIKSFKFESEKIELTLNIKKEVKNGYIKMFIDGNLISNNSDVKVGFSTNITSKNFNLSYQNNSFFWISSNEWKGMRWINYKNETKFAIYRNLIEMKEEYIKQREFITIISNYFYKSINKYKEIKLLFETNLEEIVSEEEEEEEI